MDRQSATIGRALDNTLVLTDPKRYISSHHAAIDYRDPDFYLTDTSTNGVIVNNATQPLGKGNSVRLNDGDQLHIGDYTLSVNLTAEQPVAADITTGPLADEHFAFDEDPFADLGKDSVQEMIDENQLVPEEWKGEEESEQVFDFPSFGETPREKKKSASPEVDQPPAYKEAFEPFHGESEKKTPETPDIFAEDWFLDKQEKPAEHEDPFAGDWSLDKKSTEKAAEAEPSAEDRFFEPPTPVEENQPATPPEIERQDMREAEPEPPRPQIPTPPKPAAQPASVPSDAAFEQVVSLFLQGAGLEASSLKQALTPESFYIIGKILRASVQGTLDVLIGRAKIKNEMHLDVTMIRSKQNNPIKFSVSAEEAIKKLLAPEDVGYLAAEEAIEEAFDDIKAHQYSVIAGMQTALLEVLKRFDPQKLEHRLQEESPISASIPIHKQAKLWRLFAHLYQDIEHEATDNFYHLFGQAFAETYQQQINQLKNAKKETPF